MKFFAIPEFSRCVNQPGKFPIPEAESRRLKTRDESGIPENSFSESPG